MLTFSIFSAFIISIALQMALNHKYYLWMLLKEIWFLPELTRAHKILLKLYLEWLRILENERIGLEMPEIDIKIRLELWKCLKKTLKFV